MEFVNIHAIKDSLTGNLAEAVIMAYDQGLLSFRWALPGETRATQVIEYDSAAKNWSWSHVTVSNNATFPVPLWNRQIHYPSFALGTISLLWVIGVKSKPPRFVNQH